MKVLVCLAALVCLCPGTGTAETLQQNVAELLETLDLKQLDEAAASSGLFQGSAREILASLAGGAGVLYTAKRKGIFNK